jgi:predicted O-linked N-acetylglucosamine transferase (SPINDLY family)
MRHWISQRYLAAGGRAEQLEFEDNRQRSDLFSFLAEVDLLLDTTPYAGALSSCDALWMGVPVVSLSGGQRIADSIAATLKLEDFLARSPEHFAELVRQLASQPEVLSSWRQCLRARLRASAFCQGAQQAQSAEAAYDELWQQWCQATKRN